MLVSSSKKGTLGSPATHAATTQNSKQAKPLKAHRQDNDNYNIKAYILGERRK